MQNKIIVKENLQDSLPSGKFLLVPDPVFGCHQEWQLSTKMPFKVTRQHTPILQDIWERHMYFMDPEKAWAMRNSFDGATPEKDGQIFVSEFATLDQRTSPVANLQVTLLLHFYVDKLFWPPQEGNDASLQIIRLN